MLKLAALKIKILIVFNLLNVDKLGDFIEVECMSSEKIDGAQVQQELFAFLSKLGIQEEDRVLQGYYTMIVNLEQVSDDAISYNQRRKQG